MNSQINIGWFIGLASGSILFFLAYFLLSRINYKNRFKDKYDIRNHFPYEFNYESKFVDNILGNSALILSIGFAISLFALGLVYFKTNGYVLFVIISGAIYSLLILLMNFLPLKNVRIFMIFSIFLFVASFFVPAALGLTAFSLYQQFRRVIDLIVMIVSFTFALIYFVMIMNPRLSFDIRLETKCNDDGENVLVRPKYVSMAFTQWLMFFGLLISEILFILLIVLFL